MNNSLAEIIYKYILVFANSSSSKHHHFYHYVISNYSKIHRGSYVKGLRVVIDRFWKHLSPTITFLCFSHLLLIAADRLMRLPLFGVETIHGGWRERGRGFELWSRCLRCHGDRQNKRMRTWASRRFVTFGDRKHSKAEK